MLARRKATPLAPSSSIPEKSVSVVSARHQQWCVWPTRTVDVLLPRPTRSPTARKSHIYDKQQSHHGVKEGAPCLRRAKEFSPMFPSQKAEKVGEDS